MYRQNSRKSLRKLVYGNYEIYGTCEEDETIPEHEIEIQ